MLLQDVGDAPAAQRFSAGIDKEFWPLDIATDAYRFARLQVRDRDGEDAVTVVLINEAGHPRLEVEEVVGDAVGFY